MRDVVLQDDTKDGTCKRQERFKENKNQKEAVEILGEFNIHRMY